MPPFSASSPIEEEEAQLATPSGLRPSAPYLEWVRNFNEKNPSLAKHQAAQAYLHYFGPPPEDEIEPQEQFFARVKANNPTLSDFKINEFYDQTYGVARRALGEPDPEKGDLFRGFKIALKQNPELAHGVSALAASTGETTFGEGGMFTAWKQSALKSYKEWADDIGKDSKKTDSISYAWERASEHGEVGGLVDFLQFATGYIGGQVATVLGVGAMASLLGGPASGVTAAIASASAQAGARKSVLQKVVGESVQKLIDKEAAKLAGKGLAGQELQKEAVRNASKYLASRSALLPYETLMEAGEIGGETVRKATEEGRTTDPLEIARSVGASIVAGIVGFAEDIVGLKALRGSTRINQTLDTAQGLPGKVARSGAQGTAFGAAGAATEYVQTGIEQVGMGEPLDTPEAHRARVDAAGVGAVGGATIGGVGGYRQQTALEAENPPQDPPETPVDEARLRLRQEVERARAYSRRQAQARQAADQEMEAVPKQIGVFDPKVGLDEAIQRAEDASGTDTDITDIVTESMIDQALDFQEQVNRIKAEEQSETVGEGLPAVDLPKTTNNLGAFEGGEIAQPGEEVQASPEQIAPPLSPRERLKQEKARLQQRRAYEPINQPTDTDLIKEPRSRLPEDQNAEVLARAMKAQADLDITREAGDTPSLMEFLRSKGGVQDQGGELAQLEIDRPNKPFTKNLVQAKGMTLDEAAEAAHEAGILPERDVNLLLNQLDHESRGMGTGPEWYDTVTTGKGALTPERVDTALEKIRKDKGLDVGKDVEKVKKAILADEEFTGSHFAPTSEMAATALREDVQRERQEGLQELGEEVQDEQWQDQFLGETEPAYNKRPSKPDAEQRRRDVEMVYNALAERDYPNQPDRQARLTVRGGVFLEGRTIGGQPLNKKLLAQAERTVKQMSVAQASQPAAVETTQKIEPPKATEPKATTDDFQLTAPEQRQRPTKQAVDQAELFGTGETLQTGTAPIIGREATREEAPLFSKEAQEADEEQSNLFEGFQEPVYHGTPHTWSPEPGFPHGRPRLDKMGTGEGAQAFGWGFYTAGAEETARYYQRSLGYKGIVKQFRESLPDDADIDDIEDILESGNVPQNKARVLRALQKDDWLGFDYPAQAISAAFQPDAQARYDLSPETVEAVRNYSSVYKFDIPDEIMPKLLDWDKPLSEQSDHVKEALAKAGFRMDPWIDESMHHMASDRKTVGQDIYERISHRFKRPEPERSWTTVSIDTEDVSWSGRKKAAEYLRSLGIPGLKYLDGMSRKKGEGNHNYVIWDQAVLDKMAIMEKNGQVLDAMQLAQEQAATYSKQAQERPTAPIRQNVYPLKLKQYPVKTKAIIASSREEITITDNALDALKGLDTDIRKYQQLMECLAS